MINASMCFYFSWFPYSNIIIPIRNVTHPAGVTGSSATFLDSRWCWYYQTATVNVTSKGQAVSSSVCDTELRHLSAKLLILCLMNNICWFSKFPPKKVMLLKEIHRKSGLYRSQRQDMCKCNRTVMDMRWIWKKSEGSMAVNGGLYLWRSRSVMKCMWKTNGQPPSIPSCNLISKAIYSSLGIHYHLCYLKKCLCEKWLEKSATSVKKNIKKLTYENSFENLLQQIACSQDHMGV